MAKKLTVEEQIAKQVEKVKKEQETLQKLKEKNAVAMGKVAMKYFDNADDLKRFLTKVKSNGYLQKFYDAKNAKIQQQSAPIKPMQNVATIDTIKSDNLPI